MATRAHLEGNKRYLGTLDEIRIRVPKGRKEEIQGFAKSKGKSTNAFIVNAIENEIQREKEKVD